MQASPAWKDRPTLPAGPLVNTSLYNQEQWAAIAHPIGEAALLIAGAGSGKTHVLTGRVEWLLEQGVAARHILGLTFTNKAAKEIERRVLARTQLDPSQAPRLCTIHGLALKMIRRNPTGFGLDKNVSPLDEGDQYELLKKIVDRLGKEEAQGIVTAAVKNKIGYHRARGVGFAALYTGEVHKQAVKAHAGYHALADMEVAIWKEYEEEKRINSAVDFDDMLALVNRRMVQDPEWGAKVQSMFQHVLMDEAQDTNMPCWELVNHLVGPGNRNLFVAGDISQSIYGWNGAQPALILAYAESWRGATPAQYRMARNHRSNPEIVKLANAIQQRMTATLPLTMVSHRGEQGEHGSATIFRRSDPRDLACRVVAEIRQTGAPYSEYAILVRAASQSSVIEADLIRNRIPYVVRGGKGVLQTEEVRDMLAYIRLATNPKDFAALSRAAQAPRQGIGDTTLEAIRSRARLEFDGDLVKAAFVMGGKTAALAETIRHLIPYCYSPAVALDHCIGRTQYQPYLMRRYRDRVRVEEKMENLARLREMMEGIASEQEMTTEDLIFQLTMDRSEEADGNGMVTISTIHSAKGLEWKYVFLFNVVEGVLPHNFSKGTEEEIEEERRLFYVGVTRARDHLYLTVSEQLQFGERLVDAEQSRFLTELRIRA